MKTDNNIVICKTDNNLIAVEVEFYDESIRLTLKNNNTV